MAFHEIRFPTALSLGSAGGPERKTEIVTLANGYEERNSPWANSRRRYDAGLGMRSLDDIQELVAFFEARQGQLYGFRWKDWSDYKSCAPSQTIAATDQEIGPGDGETRVFALRKAYGSGGHVYSRPIKKPVADSVLVALDGAVLSVEDFAVDLSTGLIELSQAPQVDAVVSAGFEFDVPVRFDVDQIVTSVSGFHAGDIPSVPVIEVRV
ncbi:DUF2460 domain-containing protein [Qingshengfaniella alkalisoli]|uniref:TIGR02217 family protein n=1 Tax=Qingshengfaniella alkalisoli TaxID=2599296 RepID=A0A5B8J369_9RHOB|nr:DUF2460 domain-containing protein [Qingshengfaniella alkalisoli]QDY68927.1 TIGR02217 family protein [Qingshengfaniella alkalisoli]